MIAWHVKDLLDVRATVSYNNVDSTLEKMQGTQVQRRLVAAVDVEFVL